MSKVSTDHMRTCIQKVLEGSQEKKREFMETVELPHIPRPKLRICILGDAFHCEKAAGLGLDFKNADGLKAFNKNKKLIKKFAKKYQVFLASESLIKQIPRLLGPGLNKAGKFPTLVTQHEDLGGKVDEIKA